MNELVDNLADLLIERRWRMATVESCTGGWIGKCCTDLAGSSAWFNGGLVTYSNAAQVRLSGVSEALIRQHGAVSKEVAAAMADGGAQALGAEVSVAVTGVAGPSGGSPDKPVGLVWFGWHIPGRTECESRLFTGNRDSIRQQTVAHALRSLIHRLDSA